MTCASCAAHVERALREVQEVTEVNVNLATEWAAIEYNPDGLAVADFVQVIQDTGYEVPVEVVNLQSTFTSSLLRSCSQSSLTGLLAVEEEALP